MCLIHERLELVPQKAFAVSGSEEYRYLELRLTNQLYLNSIKPMDRRQLARVKRIRLFDQHNRERWAAYEGPWSRQFFLTR